MGRSPGVILRCLLSGALLFGAPAAQAQINVRPDALTNYSYCVNYAKDRGSIFLLERGTLYRCIDEVAVSYFNYLGRIKAPERRVREAEGEFIYRTINGVGKCWNMIADPAGLPVSIYGCDIYIEL